MDTLILNEDQLAGLERLKDFLKNSTTLLSTTTQKQIRLVGPAGTGKTTLLKHLISKRDVSRWVFAAPTNKATGVLRSMLKEYSQNFRTIYSVLGLRMQSDEDRMILTRPFRVDLSHLDVIVIDEAGMVNAELKDYVQEAVRMYDLKVIWVADQYQLPPVGEPSSCIFDIDCAEVVLSKVERHDNQILTLATYVRSVIHDVTHNRSGGSLKDFVSDNDKMSGVWALSQDRFLERIKKYANNGEFSGKEPSTVGTAWRNKTVDYMNGVVRQCLFSKEERQSGQWLVGDRIVLTAPVQEHHSDAYDEVQMKANTDDSGIILDVAVVQHPVYREYGVYMLCVELDTGEPINLTVAHESSHDAIMRRLQMMASDARKPGKSHLWKGFWKFKESFHSIKYGYCMTVHRMQGSTTTNIFVDTEDILYNPSREEALRCLYVGLTRPTTKLFLH